MKKLLATLLAIIMAFSLVACGDKSEAPKDSDENPAIEQPAASGEKGESSVETQDAYTEALLNSGVPKGDWVIAYADGTIGNAWRASHYQGFIDCAENMKANGFISDYLASQASSVEDMIASIEDYISRGVDAICVENDYGNALGAVLKKALDAGIVVVTTGDAGLGTSHGGNMILVNSNNSEYMTAPCEYLAWKLGGEGTLVHIYGAESTDWIGVTERQNAITAVFDRFGISESYRALGSYTESVANEAMTALLNAHGDELGGDKVAVVAEDVGLGIIQAYQAAGVDFPVLSGGYTFGYIRAIRDNPDLIAAAALYPPGTTYAYAYAAILKLNGYELDPAKAEYMGLENSICCPCPGVIVRDENEISEEWTQYLAPTSQVWTVEEALAGNEDKSDNDCFDYKMNIQEMLDNFYQK